VSSQFLTGLLQALPMTGREVTVEIEGELISRPYVDMTVALMRRFGVSVERDGGSRFTIASHAQYTSPGTYVIEGDASNASYFLAAGAIAGTAGRCVRVEGVGRASIQGDVAFADALERMGATIDWWPTAIACARNGPLRGIDIDCTAIPDAAMTLAVVALFGDGATLLRGIGSWRVKETDRIAAMATELAKLGARIEAGADWLRIEPTSTPQTAAIDTYDDHRMAMCFSLASLLGVPIRINDPQCVAKTYPDYFDDFARIVR
jgi:3-phosphoshikimate 1-carboxyvinyltransferase